MSGWIRLDGMGPRAFWRSYRTVADILEVCVADDMADCSLVTMFLYMISELSALSQVIEALTGLNSLPVVIVECVVTTIYTSKNAPRDED